MPASRATWRSWPGRIGLAWIFIYHGAGTLFGAFGRGGIHPQAVYFAHVAHLHPGTFFAVLGGIIEFFGGSRGRARASSGAWPPPGSSVTW